MVEERGVGVEVGRKKQAQSIEYIEGDARKVTSIGNSDGQTRKELEKSEDRNTKV